MSQMQQNWQSNNKFSRYEPSSWSYWLLGAGQSSVEHRSQVLFLRRCQCNRWAVGLPDQVDHCLADFVALDAFVEPEPENFSVLKRDVDKIWILEAEEILLFRDARIRRQGNYWVPPEDINSPNEPPTHHKR